MRVFYREGKGRAASSPALRKNFTSYDVSLQQMKFEGKVPTADVTS
jgi:hypothetical protein